jgi:hypothetical protein
MVSMQACNVSSRENQTIYAHFPLQTTKHTTDEWGLLDSGATHNFIDICTIIHLGIGTRKLKSPRTVTNVDSTSNQARQINQYANLQFNYDKRTKELPVFVTNLGRDRIILGLPWFQEFEPTISWKQGELLGQLTVKTSSKVPEINKTMLATSWAIKEESDKTRLSEKDIPDQYKDYVDVFSEEKAKRFPLKREEDHEIKFINDVPKFFKGDLYSLTVKQTAFLRRWLDEKLSKGFIRPSKLPYPSPTFLIEKKNRDYRIVQNYQMLNRYTVSDKHPLPLITNLIEQLHEKMLFTKFDICMGYNNIRIAEGDQEKAAFTTPLGQYEPMVMNFGFCNASATFVRAMTRVFRILQNKYPREILIYMDDILVAMPNDLPHHRQIVQEVLQVMREESFFLKAVKCEFEKQQVEYLGLILNGDSIKPDPVKVNGLKTWPRTLKTISEVCSTLGLLNYHCTFILSFSHIVKLLTQLLKKNTKFL